MTKLTTATKLFVYGTLKRGHINHRRFLEGATFLGTDVLPEHATDTLLPLAVEQKGFALEGEVYTNLTPRQWEAIETLEYWSYTRVTRKTAKGDEVEVYLAKGLIGWMVRPANRWPNVKDDGIVIDIDY